MKNLLYYELRKHLTRFTVIFTAVMLVLNLGVVFLQYMDQLNPEAGVIREAQDALLADYREDRPRYDADYEAYLIREEEFEEAVNARRNSDVWYSVTFSNEKIDLVSYGDQKLYAWGKDLIRRTEGYNDIVKSVLRSSYSKVREIGILPGNYVYEYQAAVIGHYTPLTELEVPVEAVRGWEEFFTLKTPVVFQSITMLGIFAGIFITEKRARTLNLLRICRKGGWQLILAKLLSTGIFSAVLTLLFTLTPLGVLAVTTGFSSPACYVQTMETLQMCPYALEIRQYLFLFLGVKLAVFLVFALFISVLGQILGGELPVLSASSVFLLLSYLLSAVDNSASPLFPLRQYNFFDTAFVNILFDRYRAVNLFGIHVGLIPFMAVLMGIIFLILIAVTFTVGLRSRFLAIQSEPLKKRLGRLIKRHTKPVSIRTGTLSVLRYEFDKNLLHFRGILVVTAALLVKILVSSVTFLPLESNMEQIYRDYLYDLRGEVTQAQEDYIREEQEYLSDSLREYEEAVVRYRGKELSYEEFSTFTQRKNYAELVEQPFTDLLERQAYLSRISKDTYDNIEYVYEAGVIKYLFSFFDAVLVILILALLSDTVSREYQSGFIMILSLTKYGGKKTLAAKYRFGFLVITALYLLFSAVDAGFLLKNYDIYYLHAGLMSIPELKSLEWNLSVGGYLVLYKLVSYVGFLLLGSMMISLSAITKNVLISAVISLGIILIPVLTASFGVDVLRWIDITGILAPSVLTENLPQYGIYTALAVALYAAARKKWLKK